MDREAAVRITLDNSQFLVSIRRTGDEVANESKKAAKEASRWSAGLDKAKDSMKEMGSKMKDLAGTALTFGGAIGFVAMAKHALDLREKVRDIEFNMNKAGKATMNAAELMKKVREAADDTGKSTDELSDVMSNVFEATGNAEFAVTAMTAVGHAAQASGMDVGKLGDAAAVLQRKFGATGETVDDMLAVFVEKSGAGGLSLDELGTKFGLLAGEAAGAGMTGTEGLSSLLGMLETLNPAVGEKAVPALKQMFQILKTGSKDIKGFEKELKSVGVELELGKAGTFEEKMRKILSSGKAREKFAEKLGGEQRIVFDEIAKPFTEAFEEAKKNGQKSKEATQTGLAAFDEAMQKMAKHTMTADQILEESKKGQLEDPMTRIHKAIDKVEEAFTRPEMLNALDKVAEAMPAFADALAKLMSFIAKNPILAGTAFVGGKGLLAFAGGALTAKGGGGAAGEAADAVSKAGEKLATTASKSSAWAVAGRALGIAGAALVAFEIGKELIDSGQDKHFEGVAALGDARHEGEQAAQSGTMAEKKAAYAKLGAAEAAEYDNDPDLLTEGASQVAHLFDSSVPTAKQAQGDSLRGARETMDKLERQINRKSGGQLAREAYGPGPNNFAEEFGGHKSYAGTNLGTSLPGTGNRGKVTIENEEPLAAAFAKQLRSQTLKVEIVGGSPGGSGTRGPLKPPPPFAGS